MKQELPSMMLHGITGDCDSPCEQSSEEKFYDITEGAFLTLLDTIASRGLNTITSADLDVQDTTHRILISFDDGRASDFAVALPALAERHMRGVFFVVTDWIGRQGFMTTMQLREMLSQSMDIQVHGKTHHFLADLADNTLHAELRDAKVALEDILGREVNGLAYPGGRGGKRVQAIARELGYRHFFCSRPGWYRRGMQEVPRMVLHGGTSNRDIARYLDGKRGPVWRQGALHVGGRILRGLLGPEGYSSLKSAVRGH